MASATAAGVVQRFGSTFGMSRRFWGVSMVSGSTALTRIAAAELRRERLGEARDRRFRGGVGPHASCGMLAGGGADVDDRAAVGEAGGGRTAHVEAAGEVDVEHPSPGGGIAVDLLPGETAGDVGDHVGAAQRGLGLGERPRRGLRIGQVDAADLRRRRTGRRRRKIDERNGRALRFKGLCDRPAERAEAARDQHPLRHGVTSRSFHCRPAEP